MAAEVGHLLLDPRGPLCGCGHAGHIEALASGTDTIIAEVNALKTLVNEFSRYARMPEMQRVSARYAVAEQPRAPIVGCLSVKKQRPVAVVQPRRGQADGRCSGAPDELAAGE